MILDVVALLILAYGFFIGYTRGIIKTAFSALSIVIGIVVSLKLSPILIGFLQNNFDANPALLFVVGLIMTFLIALFLIRFIGNKVEKLFEVVRLNFINKLAGAGVMVILFTVILSYTFWFLGESSLISKRTIDSSITYSLFEPVPEISKGVVAKAKPLFQEFWTKMMDTVETIKEKSGTEEIDLGEF